MPGKQRGNMKRLALIGIGLLGFGWLYAYRIAVKPFPPHLTWLSVVVGDAVTDAGTSAALWVLTHDWRAALVPWGGHALTGTSMIVVQVLKHRLLSASARASEAYDNPA